MAGAVSHLDFLLVVVYNMSRKIHRKLVISITIQQKIDMACAHAGINKTELARRLNTSPSAFKQRLTRGKFDQEDLEKIANALNGEYFSGFKFKDGTVID